ncbi:putative aspartyl/Asparaginyl beta-hydroxylase [Tribonema minus]|uniref:Putative aspartyl/Asparaginyl beta-hydroxylase n=1 Tax=Tribonema minus TaxID=303371 RepID=A0A836CPE8_9STRA|nr:putative aspartyl/Asparaginyl beta-hydroxylase [Tribonema minus]
MSGKPVGLTATLVKSAICRTTAKCRPHPTLFFFPGLSSKTWHEPHKDTTHDTWVRRLESSYDAVKREYLDLVEKRKAASDYDVGTEHKLHKGHWDWHSYVLKGQKQPSFAEACPITAQLLDATESHMTGTPMSYSFFSTLHPRSAIAPHTAACNLRLRCHFPLIVPSTNADECGIRVGDEVRAWEEGKAMLFDDAYEHEVWNHTGSQRVVLLFDIWHPELVPDERTAIMDMFGYARQQGWMK